MLAENASDVVVLIGPDGRIMWVSPAVTRRLGWGSEDLLGTLLVELVHPDDAVATADARAQVYSGEEVTAPPGGFLMRFRTKSGEYVWMSGLATPVKDESGAHVGVVSGLRNVDELVHAREAAQMDQAAIRATVDSLLDPHILLEAVRDETGQIVDFVYVGANSAACAYNRMDYEELIGARLLDLLPGHATVGLLDQYRQVVETGEPLVQDDIVYAQELLGGVERHYDARASRVGDGLSYTWRDVTDRFEAAQRLAESEEHYRLLAENASDVVMRLSPAWRYEWVSGSVVGLLGWEPPDLVGRLIDEFVHPDDRARFRQVADTAPGTAMSVEFRFRRPDETYRWVVCRTRLKVDEDGAPVAVVGGLVDVEDRKAAEAKEQDRLRELEQFQKLTVGRELKMIELKKEIEYLRKLGPAVPAAAVDAETRAVTDRRRDQPR
jgi:PAS domain S-box-containing protein